MNDNRIVVAEFCDDIRHEVGFKYSLMGCYSGGELIVDSLPIVLPKLFTSIIALSPIDKPFLSLTFRAYLNTDLISENEIPAQSLKENYASIIDKANDSSRFSITIHMGFVPLVIQQNSVLRIEAETEDGIIKGSRLSIRQRLETDPPVIQSE